jgi:hypothetical protein
VNKKGLAVPRGLEPPTFGSGNLMFEAYLRLAVSQALPSAHKTPKTISLDTYLRFPGCPTPSSQIPSNESD